MHHAKARALWSGAGLILSGDFVGGPSGPMPLAQVAAIRAKGIGPEGPPTRAEPGLKALPARQSPGPVGMR
ncbi:DUF6053 domain-containing protein [Lysobacter enzymogenes]|uniref:DUF6053 domain-containing protein n=1 Tax=Lysobacter enzymogenes TaxID=69 RepID=UPI003395E170